MIRSTKGVKFYMDYIKNPNNIEEQSFIIIQEIIDDTRPEYRFSNEIEEKIIKRAIHTTADFDYLDILKISDTAIDEIVAALKNKATIYTDTNMALSGINKKILDKLGCEYRCLVSCEEVARYAKENNMTRSMAAVEVAAKDENDKIFVFGNAPTAVYRAIEMIEEGRLEAKAIIGVPVGFVGASDSKDCLHQSDIPSIVSLGRKGGSNLAAAIVNAILYYYFR